MADSQEYNTNGDFSADVGGEDYQQDDQMNGEGQDGQDNTNNQSSANSGKDDDR